MNLLSRSYALTLILALLMMQPFCSYAQSLKQYIPAESSMVLGVNWANLESKLSFSQINKSESFLGDEDPFMALFVKILDNPNSFGLDLKEQTYFFHEMGDTFNNRVVVLALSNRTIFTEKVEDWLKTNDNKARFRKSGAMMEYANGTLAISCTGDMAILLLGKDRYISEGEYSNSDFNYWHERRKVVRQIDSIRYSNNDPYAEEMSREAVEEEEPQMEEGNYEEGDAGDYDVLAPPLSTEAEMLEESVVDSTTAVVIEEYYQEEGAGDDEIVEVAEPAWEEVEIEEVYVEEATSYDGGDSYPYDKHPLMKKLNAKRDAIEKEEEIARKKLIAQYTSHELKRYWTIKPEATNARNTQFNGVMNHVHDITLWINPALLHTAFSRDMYRNMLERGVYQDTAHLYKETAFDRLMKNNVTYAFGDFDKGSFHMTFIQEKNKELQEFEYVKTTKVNAAMLSYLNTETFGYYAANLSIPDFFESYRKIMMALIESSPIRAQYTAQFELMDIFINKDIFYNTLAGDGVFAFTGLTTQIKNTHKYLSDPETFEQQYKEVSDTTLFPEVLFMGSISKQENIDRLILAFEHMGMFIKVKNNVYEILKEPHGASTYFYVAHHGGILYVTNDQDLVLKYIETGLPKSEQLSGEAKELLNKYGNCQYWNSSKSFDAILALGTNFKPREKGKIRVLQNHLAVSTMYTTRLEGRLETHAHLNFSDASINSLTELINLLHELEITR